MNSVSINEQQIRRNGISLAEDFSKRLSEIELMVKDIYQILANQKPAKDWYTVRETAEIFGRSEFTVREWCRLGRICADKRACGRGTSKEWIISCEEVQRIQNEGLLPHRTND